MNLFEDSDGEQGNYIKIETEVIQKFDYRQMHEVFCLSSQTVLDWKVNVNITETNKAMALIESSSTLVKVGYHDKAVVFINK